MGNQQQPYRKEAELEGHELHHTQGPEMMAYSDAVVRCLLLLVVVLQVFLVLLRKDAIQ